MGQTGRFRAGLGQRLQRGAVAVVFAGITVTGALVGAKGAIALPTFTDTVLPGSAANPLSAPTAIVPLLDTGRALVLEKAGAVRILGADGTLLDNDAIDLSVCTDSEMGLLGAAVDPDSRPTASSTCTTHTMRVIACPAPDASTG